MNNNDENLLRDIATIVDRIGVPFLKNLNNLDFESVFRLFREDKNLAVLAMEIFFDNMYSNLANGFLREHAIDEFINSGKIKVEEKPENLLNHIRVFVRACEATKKWDELSIFYPFLNSMNKGNLAIPYVDDKVSTKIENVLRQATSEIGLKFEDLPLDKSYVRKRLLLNAVLKMEHQYKIFLDNPMKDVSTKMVDNFDVKEDTSEKLDEPSWKKIFFYLILAFIVFSGSEFILKNW